MRFAAPRAAVFSALTVLAAACRHQPPAVAPAPAAFEGSPCWWTVFRSPLPLDTVAAHLVSAFTTLGLSNATSAQEGDTIRAEAGPTRLDERFGGTYSARMVAFRRGDSTLYRYFVVASPPSGGWRPSYDSLDAAGRHVSVNPAGSELGLCAAIASTSQNHGTAPKEPNGEESLAVWSVTAPTARTPRSAPLHSSANRPSP